MRLMIKKIIAKGDYRGLILERIYTYNNYYN